MIIKRVVKTIAVIEMTIGLTTITGLIVNALFFISKKPASVFIFVLISAAISSAIGFGLFKYREWAKSLLVFFSGYIIITKILIFTGLLQFSGEIFTAVPADVKNWVSVSYHFFIILFMSEKAVRKIFE